MKRKCLIWICSSTFAMFIFEQTLWEFELNWLWKQDMIKGGAATNRLVVGLAITALKVCISKVFLVRHFPHSDWIRRDTTYLSVFSPNVRNKNQTNSEYEHFTQYIFFIPFEWRKFFGNYLSIIFSTSLARLQCVKYVGKQYKVSRRCIHIYRLHTGEYGNMTISPGYRTYISWTFYVHSIYVLDLRGVLRSHSISNNTPISYMTAFTYSSSSAKNILIYLPGTLHFSYLKRKA